MISRSRLYRIVFGTDTTAGKKFDIWLLWVILFSVLVVMLESVPELGIKYHNIFLVVEWSLTIIFTIEYLLRIMISPKPIKYITSFWGGIDLLAILPTYLSFFLFGYHYLIIVRTFRLLRVFRILKLARFNSESIVLLRALKSGIHKLSVFLFTMMAIVVVMGTLMYVVEGGEKGFTSIPQSMYWAIVTITTVGYGDMVPQSAIGKVISSVAMIMGYAIIAVPTGIFTVEMAKARNRTDTCPKCNHTNPVEAKYCNNCGVLIEKLD